jgi:hypothetical protein
MMVVPRLIYLHIERVWLRKYKDDNYVPTASNVVSKNTQIEFHISQHF